MNTDPTLLLDRIQHFGGYKKVRLLPDGSVAALGDLIFTRAIYLGCHNDGWEHRFCYSNREMADQIFEGLVTENDTPVGWIARR